MIDVPVEADGRRRLDLGNRHNKGPRCPLKVWYTTTTVTTSKAGSAYARQPYDRHERPANSACASAGDRRDSTADCF